MARSILAAACSLMANAVVADGGFSVWYRFENIGVADAEIVEGTRFDNEVDPDLYPAYTRRSEIAASRYCAPLVKPARPAPFCGVSVGPKGEPVRNDSSVAICKGTAFADVGQVVIDETGSQALTSQTFTVEFMWNTGGALGDAWLTPFCREARVDTSLKEDAVAPPAFSIRKNGGSKGWCLMYSYVDADGVVHYADSQTVSENVIQGFTVTEDADWHHYAITVGGDHVARFYVDHALKKEVTLAGDIYWGEDPSAHPWIFGGNYYGYRAPGCLDEFRISSEALDPSQMLYAVFPAKTGDAIMYMPFDTDQMSIVNQACNPDGTGDAEIDAAAKIAAGNPSFVADTATRNGLPPANCFDFERGVNLGAFKHVNNSDVDGQISYTLAGFGLDQAGFDKLTVEFFFRATDVQGSYGWNQLVQLSNSTKEYPFVFQFQGNGKGLGCRVDSYKSTSGTPVKSATNKETSPSKVLDGAWHHIAVTIDSSDGVHTTSAYFIDYNKIGEQTSEGVVRFLPDSVLRFGSDPGNSGLSFEIDEFRILRGCIDKSAFMTADMVKKESAPASALAWYRFESLPAEGGQPEGTQIRNSVDPYKFVGILSQYEQEDATRKYVAPVPTPAWAKWDVMRNSASASATFENHGALCIKSTEKRALKKGAALRIGETADATLVRQDLTIEFLMKLGDIGNLWSALFSRNICVPDDGRDVPEVLSLRKDGKAGWTFMYTYVDSDGATHENVHTSNVNVPEDDAWHHHAITVCQATHELKYYIDRKLVATFALEGDLYYGTETDKYPWVFGGNYYGYSLPEFSIDEIRFSDHALQSSEFFSRGLFGMTVIIR